MKVDAILLAGDRRASKAVRNKNKAFLQLKGDPLIVHVLRALQAAESVNNIYVVGPKQRLDETLQSFEVPVTTVEQGENMIANVKAGFEAAHSDGETPIMVVPCDIPLVTGREIDEFVKKSDLENYDYAIGITDKSVLEHYAPTEKKPGLDMICFHVKDGLFRQNNLHLARPNRLKHLDHIEKMYEWRYQTHFFNILRLGISLLFSSWHFFTAMRVFILLQLSLYYDRHGHPTLSRKLRDHAPLETLNKGISHILGARVETVYTTLGGATLDVDNDESLDVIEQMYDEWMDYQLAQR
ncbi:nucleotidyltransferase family protein [Verrucomicrobiota bacterium]